MRPLLLPPLGIPLLALLLAACSTGGGRIHYSHYGNYSYSIAQYGARTGEMALAVFGNPTAASPAALAAAVADALDGTHVNRRTVFVPTDPPQTDSYRTVVVFGATTLETICAPAPAAPAKPVAGTAGRIGAAYCHADEPLSFVSARHPALAGPRDPALQALLRGIGYELFPPENPEHRADCGGPFCE